MAVEVEVCTYNIRLGIETSLGEVASAIRTLEPDLVALQEVGRGWSNGDGLDQTRWLAGATGLSHFLFAQALATRDGLGGYGIGLLSRFPFDGAFEVRDLIRERDEQRVAFMQRVSISGSSATVIGTHLSIQPAERREQAASVAGIASGCVGPVLCLGDFNEEPAGPVYERMTERLMDSGAGHDGSDTLTFSTRRPNRRIDYIFVSSHWTVLRTAFPDQALLASDHFPVTARLSLS